jgi:hypothetical protein
MIIIIIIVMIIFNFRVFFWFWLITHNTVDVLYGHAVFFYKAQYQGIKMYSIPFSLKFLFGSGPKIDTAHVDSGCSSGSYAIHGTLQQLKNLENMKLWCIKCVTSSFMG